MKIFSKTPKAFVLPVALLCSSVWADVVYINENGLADTLRTGDYVEINSNSDLNNLSVSKWNVITGNVTFSSKIWKNGSVNIILADGASLVGEGSDDAGLSLTGNLAFYGQTKQTGKFKVTGFSQGICADNVTINGGVIEARGTSSDGIYAISGNVTINGGSVIAVGSGVDKDGISAIHGAITIGWTNNTNTIEASSFKPAIVTIATGKTYVFDGELLSGSVNASQINGKTLRPYDPSIKVSDNTLIINGDYNGLNTIEESLLDIDFGGATSRSFDNVTFNRTFPLNKYSTFMLPFEVDKSKLGGVGTLLRYNGITEDNGKVTIQMSRSVGERLSAYTPYMVLMDNPTLTVQGPVTLNNAVSATPVSSDECIANPSGEYCVWKMYGSQAYKKWTADDLTRVTVYGFAAEEKSNAYIGKFVKVGAGASIRAFRGFLANGDGSAPAQGRARYNKPVMSSIEQPELPAEIDVVIVDDDEKTTVIGKMNTRTGEIMMNRDFDLKGRRVGNNKAAHGAYYGKKVLKK